MRLEDQIHMVLKENLQLRARVQKLEETRHPLYAAIDNIRGKPQSRFYSESPESKKSPKYPKKWNHRSDPLK